MILPDVVFKIMLVAFVSCEPLHSIGSFKIPVSARRICAFPQSKPPPNIYLLLSDSKPSTSNQVKDPKTDKPMHNTNAKLVRALTNNLSDSRPSGAEVNRGNIILVRGAKTSDGGHILLRTDSLPTSKTSLVLEEGDHGKLGQIFIQQSDLAEGVLLQSVKRLGGGTPIFLLSGNDNGNGHFLIQTTSAEDVHSVADIGEEQ